MASTSPSKGGRWSPSADPLVVPYGNPRDGLFVSKSGWLVNHQTGKYIEQVNPTGALSDKDVTKLQTAHNKATMLNRVQQLPATFQGGPIPGTAKKGDGGSGVAAAAAAAAGAVKKMVDQARSGVTGAFGGGSGTKSGASTGADPTGSLFAQLLAGVNGIGQDIPTSLADMAASGDNAAVANDQQLLNQLPADKAAALSAIQQWFGIPEASLAQAGKDDAAATQAGVGSLGDISKGIIASLGGSANPGSGEVGAVGQNGANLLQALGSSQDWFDKAMGPIMQLGEAQNAADTSSNFDKQKLALAQQLATDQGKAGTDQANALMQILQANNDRAQTLFGDKSNLLNTIATLSLNQSKAQQSAISQQILDAYRLAKTKAAASAPAKGTFAATPPSQKSAVMTKIVQTIGSGPGKLANGFDWPTALKQARNIVRSNGWDPLDPQVVQDIIAPALTSVGVSFANPQTLLQP